MMRLPGSLDPVAQAEQRERRWDRRDGPRCLRCQEPVDTESYLDLMPFGIAGIACEKCVRRNSHWADAPEEVWA